MMRLIGPLVITGVPCSSSFNAIGWATAAPDHVSSALVENVAKYVKVETKQFQELDGRNISNYIYRNRLYECT